eukprot:TRINITY_DN63394_c0_g1_i1.p1 TRINITY_DN63394_c0_g1~~TRINITY_DN63394_c0_g1_i1.p1  ORF type:complete len:839 (-),score=181.13 TRINITY_DN63394_c0_g1_i1:169-2685(-)
MVFRFVSACTLVLILNEAPIASARNYEYVALIQKASAVVEGGASSSAASSSAGERAGQDPEDDSEDAAALQQRARARSAAADDDEASVAEDLDEAASGKKGLIPYSVVRMGSKANVDDEEHSTSPWPSTVFPGARQVREDARNGTLPVKVAPVSALHAKIVNLARVVQAVASADRRSAQTSSEEKTAAAGRLSHAAAVLQRLESKGEVRAVDVVDLSVLAQRNQSAESMKSNGALLTATDLSAFLVGFRGEDFGTRFNHDASVQGSRISVQGDILGTGSNFPSAAAVFDEAAGEVWPEGHIPYCYATDTSPRTKRVFEAAVAHYESLVPFLSFEQVDLLSGTSSADKPERHECAARRAIIVTSDNRYGCFSHLGMVDRVAQQLNLHDPGCALLGMAVHELGHALGMGHEHPRPQASGAAKSYVYEQRISRGRAEYFEIDDSPLRLETYMLGQNEVKRVVNLVYGGNLSSLVLESDPLSVMHFDPFLFEGLRYRRYGLPAIRNADFERMGQRVGLSRSDVRHLARLYAKQTGAGASLAVEGLGCIDGHVEAGACSSLESLVPYCSSSAKRHCCACGGGVRVQCFKDQHCPFSAINRQALYVRDVGALLLLLLLGVGMLAVYYLRRRGKQASAAAGAVDAVLASQEADAPVAAAPAHDKSVNQVNENTTKVTVGPFGKAKAQAKSAFKALANWIGNNAPAAASGTKSSAERERPAQNKLPEQVIERYNHGLPTSFGGGFSSGRDAPLAPLPGAEDDQGSLVQADEEEVMPDAAADGASVGAPLGSPVIHRMDDSDSSDNESQASDPFWGHEDAAQGTSTEQGSEDEGSAASVRKPSFSGE